MWSDSNIDLAIVKIEEHGLKAVTLGDSDEIIVGDTVYAIGNPTGLLSERTIYEGIINATSKKIKITEDEEYSCIEELIQTNITIDSINSGGPLIDEEGKIIGINTSEIVGMNLTIPINIVKPIIEKFEKTGKFNEASIGIYAYGKEIIQYIDKSLEFDEGIYVVSIDKTSSAYESGLMVGDIITKIDEIELNKMSELRNYIYTKEIGDEVNLEIIREGEIYNLKVILKKK